MEEHQIKQQAENKGCEKCGTVEDLFYWVGGWYCDKCHGMVSSPPPEVRILNIKCKPGADVLTCIAAAVKIAKATDQTIFLEIGSYSIAASKSSCELDLYKIYQKEVEG